MKRISSKMNDLETPFLVMNEEMTRKLSNLTIIHCEGNISSGKTSLCDLIRERYRHDRRVQIIYEPVELFLDYRHYNCLKSLEESPAEQAAITQALFIRLLSRYYTAIFHELPKETRIMITDRYITSTEIFINTLEEKGFITYLNKITLLDFLKDYTHNLPKPHLIFHLKRDPQWCLQNVQKRERVGEQHFCNLEYLTILERQIQEFIKEGPEETKFSEKPTPHITTTTTDRNTLLSEITNIIEYSLNQGERKKQRYTAQFGRNIDMHNRITEHGSNEDIREMTRIEYIAPDKYEKMRLKNFAKSVEKLQHKATIGNPNKKRYNLRSTTHNEGRIECDGPSHSTQEPFNTMYNREEIQEIDEKMTHTEADDTYKE